MSLFIICLNIRQNNIYNFSFISLIATLHMIGTILKYVYYLGIYKINQLIKQLHSIIYQYIQIQKEPVRQQIYFSQQKMSSMKKPVRRGRQKKQFIDDEDLKNQEMMQKTNEEGKNKLNQINENMFGTAKLDKNYFFRQQNKNNPNESEAINFDNEQQTLQQQELTNKKQPNEKKAVKRRNRKAAKGQNIFGSDEQHEQESNVQSTVQKDTDSKLIQGQTQYSQQQAPNKQPLTISRQNELQNQKISQDQEDNQIQAKEQAIAQKKQSEQGDKEDKQEDEQDGDNFDNIIKQEQQKSEEQQQEVFHLHKQFSKLQKQEKRDFYHRILPPNTVAYGYFKRFSSGLSEVFQLAGQDHRPLIFCQNQRGCIGCNFYISMTKQMDKNKPTYLGKLRGNAAGSTYFLYDSGIQPKNQINRSQWRVTMAAIEYQNNFMGMNGPRKFKVTTPSAKLLEDADSFKLSQQESLLNFKPPIVSQYRNKTPKWNEKLKSYALNFGGRVKLASLKNFVLIRNQLEAEDQQQADNVLVFGKIDQSTFSFQYRHPFSLFQAFGIVISQFDFKINCE